MASSRPTAHDIRAAAETHDEIAPEYQDAVVASFLDRIDGHIAARVDERLAKTPGTKVARKPADQTRRIVLRSVLAGSVISGIPLSIFVIAMSRQLNDGAGGGGGWIAGLALLWILIIVGNFAWAGWYRRPPD